MTLDDFVKLARYRFNACLGLMIGEKHEEYSRNNDKLYNFKRAGEIQRCIPERALIGMLSKHLVSMLDIVDDLEEGGIPEEGILTEKITDSINYLVLLEGLIKERLK